MNGRFLCLSRSLCLSVYVSCSVSLSFSVCFLSVSPSLSLFSLRLCFYRAYVCLRLGLSLTLTLALSVCLSVCLSSPNFLSGCKRLYNYSTMFYVLILSLFVCLSHSLTLFSLFLCFYMPVSDYLSVSHPHPRSLCLLICLSLSLFP